MDDDDPGRGASRSSRRERRRPGGPAQRGQVPAPRRSRRLDPLQRGADLRRRRRATTAWSRSSPTSPSSARSRSSSGTTKPRLTTLFEVSSDIMAILEPDGTWHASPAGTRILGYPIGWDPEGGILSLVHPDDLELAGAALERGAGRHPRQARADPAPPAPHRRPLPLVRLHRREPDRQPDGPRPDHHRPRRHRAEDRRGRAGRGRGALPRRVRALAARHRAHHARGQHHRRQRGVQRDGRPHRGRADRRQPRAAHPPRRPRAHARGRRGPRARRVATRRRRRPGSSSPTAASCG